MFFILNKPLEFGFCSK